MAFERLPSHEPGGPSIVTKEIQQLNKTQTY